MKILILSIFDKTERNNELIKLHQSYLKNNRFINDGTINFFFITYDEFLQEEYKKDDENHILFLKGKEGYMNILRKTMKAIDFFQNYDENKTYYDYIVRTNISSVFDFKLLLDFFTIMPTENVYVGSIFYHLKWLDEKFGINRNTLNLYNLFNMGFFQGTCIMLSNDVFTFMLNNVEKLNYDIIDDVSIALFIREHLPRAYLTSKLMPQATVIDEKNKTYSKYSILFRHKTLDDNLDTEYINKTYQYICENGHS